MKKNVNRIMVQITIAFLVLFLAACGNQTQTSSTKESPKTAEAAGGKELETIKVRFTHNLPTSHHVALGAEKFAELVKEKSNGKIEVSVFPSGQLFDDKSTPEAISTGSVEMGTSLVSGWAGSIPATDLFNLPLFHSYDAVHKGLEAGISDVFNTEFNKYNSHVLAWMDYGFGYMASKDEALSTAEAYKGKRIRVPSPIVARYVQLLGGTPVSIGGGEVIPSLQRGTIDSASSGITSYVSRHYYEYTDYFTGPDLFAIFPIVVNLDWWNSLSDDARAILEEAGAEAQVWVAAEAQKADEEALVVLEEKGMKFEKRQVDSFKEVDDQIIKEFIDTTGETGKKLVDIAKSIPQ